MPRSTAMPAHRRNSSVASSRSSSASCGSSGCRPAVSATTSRRRPGSGCSRRSARGARIADRSPRSRTAASQTRRCSRSRPPPRASTRSSASRHRSMRHPTAPVSPTSARHRPLLDTLAARRDARTDPELRLLINEQLTSVLRALPELDRERARRARDGPERREPDASRLHAAGLAACGIAGGAPRPAQARRGARARRVSSTDDDLRTVARRPQSIAAVNGTIFRGGRDPLADR